MNSILPSSLIQKIQGDYVAANFKEGIFTFTNIDTKTIKVIVESTLHWAEENNLINNNLLDISILLKDIKND